MGYIPKGCGGLSRCVRVAVKVVGQRGASREGASKGGCVQGGRQHVEDAWSVLTERGMSWGAGRAMRRGLGAGCVIGVWDMLGGLGACVGWVSGPSKRGAVYPDRAGPVRRGLGGTGLSGVAVVHQCVLAAEQISRRRREVMVVASRGPRQRCDGHHHA